MPVRQLTGGGSSVGTFGPRSSQAIDSGDEGAPAVRPP
jgi:hypothetical protein